MRVFLLTCLTMVAFASNSLLNRLGVANGDMDVFSFGGVRLVAGALMLMVLLKLRGTPMTGSAPISWPAIAALAVYTFGFSAAYTALDAGLGALILFGLVQITMFAGAMMAGERPSAQRWAGAAMAFAGLVWLLLPGQALSPSFPHAASMAVAGVAWGIYSLIGRGSTDALRSTTWNFAIAAPIGVVIAVLAGNLTQATLFGLSMAVLAGAVTSGMGYALWYGVLPHLAGTSAAVAQLTVPVIAMIGGALLLSEAVTLQLALAAMIVLGGVALSVTARKT